MKKNYKTDFETWMENSTLQFERKNIERSRPPLDLTPVCEKASDAKTPATYFSASKEKSRKD